MKDGIKKMPVVRNDTLLEEEIPYRNCVNEVLREEYIRDCERALRKWNKTLKEEGIEGFEIKLPSRRFHRHQGIYSDHHFNPEGELISKEEFEASMNQWLLMPADDDYILSVMNQVTEPGKMANWIAPPARGINGQPITFEYVRL